VGQYIPAGRARDHLLVNTALLVLRLVPGLLFMGHGLQKLVPAKYSPPLLHAIGPRAAAGFFEQIGLRPALPSVFMAAFAEIGGGFLLAAGLVTPLATALIAATMTTAILSVHIRKGIWSTDGGFEFLLVLLVIAYVVSALGPGSLSIDSWAGIANWTGIHWAAGDDVRAGAAVGIGAVAGLLTLAAGSARKASDDARREPSAAH
jgi:putative oxidoreductase